MKTFLIWLESICNWCGKEKVGPPSGLCSNCHRFGKIDTWKDAAFQTIKSAKNRMVKSVRFDVIFNAGTQANPELNASQFRAWLNELYQNRIIKFSPWTQAMYLMPNKDLIIKQGDEIMYYAESI